LKVSACVKISVECFENAPPWLRACLALLVLWSSLAHSLQQKHSFTTHN